MKPEATDTTGPALVALVAVLFVLLFAVVKLYEPTDLLGLAVQWGTFLGVVSLACWILVEVSVPDTDAVSRSSSTVAESDGAVVEGSTDREMAYDWTPTADEVGVAVAFVALFAVGIRASLALGALFALLFWAFGLVAGPVATYWLYGRSDDRSVDLDHPFLSQSTVIRHRIQVMANIVAWGTLASVFPTIGPGVSVPFGDGTVFVPWYGLSLGALVGLGVVHVLLTRPLVTRDR